MVAYCYWANKGRRNCQPLFLLHIVFLGTIQTIVLSSSFLVLPQFHHPLFIFYTATFFRGTSYVFLTPKTHFSSDFLRFPLSSIYIYIYISNEWLAMVASGLVLCNVKVCGRAHCADHH